MASRKRGLLSNSDSKVSTWTFKHGNPARDNVWRRQQAERLLNQVQVTLHLHRDQLSVSVLTSQLWIPPHLEQKTTRFAWEPKRSPMFNRCSQNTSRLSNVSLYCAALKAWTRRKYVWYFAVEHAVYLIRRSWASMKSFGLCCLRAKL